MYAFDEHDIAAAKMAFGDGLDINGLAVANGRRHTGAARLKAHTQAGLEAIERERLELSRTRTVLSLCFAARSFGARSQSLSHGNSAPSHGEFLPRKGVL